MQTKCSISFLLLTIITQSLLRFEGYWTLLFSVLLIHKIVIDLMIQFTPKHKVAFLLPVSLLEKSQNGSKTNAHCNITNRLYSYILQCAFVLLPFWTFPPKMEGTPNFGKGLLIWRAAVPAGLWLKKLVSNPGISKKVMGYFKVFIEKLQSWPWPPRSRSQWSKHGINWKPLS